jgi:peptidoglycan/xylan/chitin deacetylase (PgdA/CDA1 family)
MDERDLEGERRRSRRETRRREIVRRRRRAFAGLSLALVAVVAITVVALASGGGGGGSSGATAGGAAGTHGHASAGTGSGGSSRAGSSSGQVPHSTVTGAATGRPGSERVPILMYHVINPPPPGAPFPGLYVQPSEFAAQMQALASAGYHAITQDQMWAYWKRGVMPFPDGKKPIVVSFDNGYQSQYTNALPVLRRLGWVGNENIQLTGLPPSQGGLSQAQIKGMVAAGWELDTQGISHADLITLSATQLAEQVAGSRKTIQQRYGVPVNWFCYPSGHYNATVIAAVKSAGYTGSTTVVPGWAGPESDPYRLPRLRVLGGTSPESLLSELAAIRNDSAPLPSYSG